MIDTILTALHLAPSTFPDDYLSIVVPIHAGTAILAAVILCPGAILARKGTRLHKNFGLLTLIATIVIVISSLFLLVDKNVTEIIISATVFPKGKYNEFYLVLLSFAFSYYSFSAVRIWHRMPRPGSSIVSSNWIDWALAALGIFTGLSFLTSSIYTLADNNVLSLVYIQAAILLLAYAFFDVYTFFSPPPADRFPWWMLHMAKTILLWLTLIRFILLRVIDLDESAFATHQAIFMIIYFCVVAAVALSLKRRLGPNRSHARLLSGG